MTLQFLFLFPSLRTFHSSSQSTPPPSSFLLASSSSPQPQSLFLPSPLPHSFNTHFPSLPFLPLPVPSSSNPFTPKFPICCTHFFPSLFPFSLPLLSPSSLPLSPFYPPSPFHSSSSLSHSCPSSSNPHLIPSTHSSLFFATTLFPFALSLTVSTILHLTL